MPGRARSDHGCDRSWASGSRPSRTWPPRSTAAWRSVDAKTSQAALSDENRRLKRMVADLSLDKPGDSSDLLGRVRWPSEAAICPSATWRSLFADGIAERLHASHAMSEAVELCVAESRMDRSEGALAPVYRAQPSEDDGELIRKRSSWTSSAAGRAIP